MTLFGPPLFAALLGLGAPELVVVLLIFLFPFMVISIVATALFLKYRQRQQWHDLVRLALEKGQPIPPYPGVFGSAPPGSGIEGIGDRLRRHRPGRRHDVRGALVLLAVGAAVFLACPPTPNGRSLLIFAYVPAFIGLALLLNALFEAIVSRKDDKNESASSRP